MKIEIEISAPHRFPGGTSAEWPAMFDFIGRVRVRELLREAEQITARFGTFEEWRFVRGANEALRRLHA